MSKVIIPKQDITKTPVLSPYIVEITQTGTEWYKIWSDGWVEQGGYFKNLYNEVVPLNIPMKNTNYTVLTSKCTDTGDYSSHVINAYTKTNKSFMVNGWGQGGKGFSANVTGHWYVCGWMAQYTLTLKDSADYVWQVNDVAVPAGEYVKPVNTKLKVEAVPNPGVEKLRSITMTVE